MTDIMTTFDPDFDVTDIVEAAYSAAADFDGYDTEIERDFAYGEADLVDLYSALMG